MISYIFSGYYNAAYALAGLGLWSGTSDVGVGCIPKRNVGYLGSSSVDANRAARADYEVHLNSVRDILSLVLWEIGWIKLDDLIYFALRIIAVALDYKLFPILVFCGIIACDILSS